MRPQDGARNPWSAPTIELWAPTGASSTKHASVDHASDLGFRAPQPRKAFLNQAKIRFNRGAGQRSGLHGVCYSAQAPPKTRQAPRTRYTTVTSRGHLAREST